MKLAKLLEELEFTNARATPIHGIKIPAGTVVQWEPYKVLTVRCIKLRSFEHSRILVDNESLTGVIQFL